jgi:queuosine precursor transporter
MFNLQHSEIQFRREVVFMMISGIFLGSLTMLNILGISRLIDLSFNIGNIHIPFTVFVGVLPYPITFLCTDLISEIYGKRRAKLVVWIGFVLNLWVLLVLYIGGILPEDPNIDSTTFFNIRTMAFGATAASMIAYLVAQFVDVNIFHYLKKLTKGKHLWLRNNGSTFISQLIDSIIVVLVTFFFVGFNFNDDVDVVRQLTIYVFSGYIFKVIAAAFDTIPFYFLVKATNKYLRH